MSSISRRRNPNPETTLINQPSTSNPRRKPSKSKRKKKKSKKTRKPNWLELPEDVWFMILSKLTTIAIIENAQKVCMLFRKLCKQPAMFKTIDVSLPGDFMDSTYSVNVMTRFAVDRSSGGLVDISLAVVCDDDTFMYIVDRSKNLKRLVLHYITVSDECLIEAVKKLPMLEELQLILCEFSDETVEAVGHACPSLKSFSLNQEGSRFADFMELANDDARAIARSMPQLRHLQLMGNNMSNEGLKAILDGCPLLESLDLRACFHINLTGDLGKRCEKIKLVRYPDDYSAGDYPRQACNAAYDEWRGQLDEDSDYIDMNMMGPFLDAFDYADWEEGDYDDFFREDEDCRLYHDYDCSSSLG